MTEFFASNFAQWALVVVTGLTVIMLIADYIMRWPNLPKRFKRTAPWLVFLYVSLTYAFAEVAHNPSGLPTTAYRIGLFTASISGFAFALLLGFGDDNKRKGDN